MNAARSFNVKLFILKMSLYFGTVTPILMNRTDGIPLFLPHFPLLEPFNTERFTRLRCYRNFVSVLKSLSVVFERSSIKNGEFSRKKMKPALQIQRS